MYFKIDNYQDFKDLLITEFTNDAVEWLDQSITPNIVELYINSDNYYETTKEILKWYYPSMKNHKMITSLHLEQYNTKFNFKIAEKNLTNQQELELGIFTINKVYKEKDSNKLWQSSYYKKLKGGNEMFGTSEYTIKEEDNRENYILTNISIF